MTAIISPLEGSFGEAGLDCCMLSKWSRGGVAELLGGKSGSRRTTECLVMGHGDSNCVMEVMVKADECGRGTNDIG